MKIAAVVVTHRGGPLLEECIASIDQQTRPPDERLVVVSNHFLPVPGPALQLGENVGYARAANAGAAATRGHLLLLNDDTRLEPDCVERLADAVDGPGAWQPRIVLADGSGRLDNLGHGFLPDGSVWARGRNGPADADPGPPGGLSGAAVLVSREVWEALGGFDPRFGSFGEDVDFSLRLLRRGWRVHAVPDAVVAHHLGATWGRGGAAKIRLIEHNRIRAAARSMPASALALLPLSTFGRYALFAALGARGRGPGGGVEAGAGRAALEGVWEGVKDLPEFLADRRRDRAAWTRGELAMWAELWRGRARWRDLVR